MPQLHLYLSKEVAGEVKRRAKSKGLSVSSYLADLVQGQIIDKWPKNFFSDVVGSWAGEPLTRPSQLELETRDEL
jgi:hypothetical protein